MHELMHFLHHNKFCSFLKIQIEAWFKGLPALISYRSKLKYRTNMSSNNNINSNNKMKGLLKGLRYISQIFDEKEPEMQIGMPTDVKHVAHIGWDGPSENYAPTWMNEFKSAPLANGGEAQEEDPVKWVCQDGISRKSSSSSRRSSSTNRNGTAGESSIKEKPEKPRQSRKPSKSSSSKDATSDGHKPRKSKDANQFTYSTSDQPDAPKKSSRRKKSKEVSAGGSSRRGRTHDMDTGSEQRSVSRPRQERRSNVSGFEGGEDNS